MFFKKCPPKFKFYSFIPEITKEYPIIKSKEYRPNWIKSAIDAYKKKTSDVSQYGIQMTSASKCPGIIEVGKLGWIITSWFDFVIETSDDKNLQWKVPSTFPPSVGRFRSIIGDPIKYMELDLPELNIPVNDNTFKLLLKISMPWVVDIPKGWSLLMLPVNYSDDVRFKCSTGILKPGSFVQAHPQIFWYKTIGPQLVKAGTPLCQLIPIPDESYSAEYQVLTAGDEQWSAAESFFIRKGNKFIRDPNVQ
jgi:hypothetical protein